jgi:hypothetical protein
MSRKRPTSSPFTRMSVSTESRQSHSLYGKLNALAHVKNGKLPFRRVLLCGNSVFSGLPQKGMAILKQAELNYVHGRWCDAR